VGLCESVRLHSKTPQQAFVFPGYPCVLAFQGRRSDEDLPRVGVVTGDVERWPDRAATVPKTFSDIVFRIPEYFFQ
jgi:hypothetical protein